MADAPNNDETPAKMVWRDAVSFWLEAGSILTTSMTFALWALKLHLPRDHARHAKGVNLAPPAGENGDHVLFA